MLSEPLKSDWSQRTLTIWKLQLKFMTWLQRLMNNKEKGIQIKSKNQSAKTFSNKKEYLNWRDIFHSGENQYFLFVHCCLLFKARTNEKKRDLDKYYYYYYYFRVFHISVSWCSFTGDWVTPSLIKSPGLFSVFWPFSIMLLFWWSPLGRQLPSLPGPLINL